MSFVLVQIISRLDFQSKFQIFTQFPGPAAMLENNEVLQDGGSVLGSSILRRTFSTNISTLGQRIRLKLGELSFLSQIAIISQFLDFIHWAFLILLFIVRQTSESLGLSWSIFIVNHNYNKIFESHWFLTQPFFNQIGVRTAEVLNWQQSVQWQSFHSTKLARHPFSHVPAEPFGTRLLEVGFVREILNQTCLSIFTQRKQNSSWIKFEKRPRFQVSIYSWSPLNSEKCSHLYMPCDPLLFLGKNLFSSCARPVMIIIGV